MACLTVGNYITCHMSHVNIEAYISSSIGTAIIVAESVYHVPKIVFCNIIGVNVAVNACREDRIGIDLACAHNEWLEVSVELVSLSFSNLCHGIVPSFSFRLFVFCCVPLEQLYNTTEQGVCQYPFKKIFLSLKKGKRKPIQFHFIPFPFFQLKNHFFSKLQLQIRFRFPFRDTQYISTAYLALDECRI